MRKLILFSALVVAASLTYANGWDVSAWFNNGGRQPQSRQLPPARADYYRQPTPPPPAPSPVFDKQDSLQRIHEQMVLIDARIARLDEAKAREIDHMRELTDLQRQIEMAGPDRPMDPVQISIRIEANKPIDRLEFR